MGEHALCFFVMASSCVFVAILLHGKKEYITIIAQKVNSKRGPGGHLGEDHKNETAEILDGFISLRFTARRISFLGRSF